MNLDEIAARCREYNETVSLPTADVRKMIACIMAADAMRDYTGWTPQYDAARAALESA